MSINSVLALARDLPRPSKSVNITLWILQSLLAVMFLFAGGLKLSDAPEMVATFEQIGIGQWFRYFTGGLEVISGTLLLIPGASALGAALLAATMVGATATHLFIIGGSPVLPIVLLLMTSVIAWQRRPARLR